MEHFFDLNKPIALTNKEERSDKVDIEILAQNLFHKRLQQIGILPKQKHFIIMPIVMDHAKMISKIMLEIKLPTTEIDASVADKVFSIVAEHTKKVSEIIAIAMSPYYLKKKPTRKMKFIERNCSPKELVFLIGIVMKHMSLPEFVIALQMMKGLNILNSEKKAEINPDLKN